MIEVTDEMWRLAHRIVYLHEQANRSVEEWIASMEPDVRNKRAMAFRLKRSAHHTQSNLNLRLKHLCAFDQALFESLIAGAMAEKANARIGGK